MECDINANMEWSIKNLKTFIGMEGQGFNVSLYEGNKLVAFVIDDARGGPLMFQWKDKTAKDRLNALVASLPPVGFEGTNLKTAVTADIFVGDLVWDLQNKLEDKRYERKLQKDCQTKTCFLLPGESVKDGWRILKTPFSAKAVAFLQGKYPGATILNT